MITFVHTADIHFGMENYGKIDPQTGIHSRLLDFNKALNFCIDIAIERNVDFFLFSGDAYKTTNPSPTQQKLLFTCFLRLQQAGIPLVIVVGNHDNPLSFGKAHSLDIFGDLPLEGFYVIDKPTAFVLLTKKGPVQIVGIPWPTRNNVTIAHKHVFKSTTEITTYLSQAVGSIIQTLAQQLDPAIPSVLAGHLTVSSGVFSGSEKRAIYGNDPIFLPSQLAIQPFDYVALGHLHRYQNLNPHGYPALVYSGSIERVDFGERKEDKGFCFVHLEKNKTTHEFIKTPMRPFIQIEVTLESKDNQTQKILEALEQHSIVDAIVKIVYHVPADKKDMVDLAAVQRACARAMHLVGVFPVRKFTLREKRTTMKIDMDLPLLLDTYFAAKQEFLGRKESLIEKALALADEVEQQKQENL